MTSKKYWEQRAAQDMYDRMGTAEDTAAEMNAAIRQTSEYLESKVKAVMRGMQSFGISEAEARRILNAAGNESALQSLRAAANRVADPAKREALLNAINSAGAYRYRIARLEQLNKDVVRQCRELYKTENRAVTSALRNVAEESYYREIFGIQKGTGLGFSFSQFSQRDVERILRSNWVGGNYSQRIWRDINGMTARLKQELLVSMLTGRSGEKTARIIREQFGVNAFCARRIVRTESAYVANAAQAQAYGEAGIERYRFIATLDSRTCECCAALDGKVFDLAKAKAGTNYPPMHPFCRSTTIADFGDEEFSQLERRAKDKDGKTVKVPAGMTYEEWKQGLSGQGGAVQLTLGDLEKSYGGMRYGELTKPHNGGIMNANRFNTTEDPMREVTGSAMSSNPDEVETMKKDLIDSGVELIITDHDMAYAPGILPGEPGQFLIDKNASFSAWCHEYKHFCDDRNDGFLGFRVFEDGPKCRQREIDAYQIEIDMAEKAGRSDIAERLKKLRDMEVAHYE